MAGIESVAAFKARASEIGMSDDFMDSFRTTTLLPLDHSPLFVKPTQTKEAMKRISQMQWSPKRDLSQPETSYP